MIEAVPDISSSLPRCALVRLSGTPYTIGYAHGKTLGSSIRQLERAFRAFLREFAGGGLQGQIRAHIAYLSMRLLAGAAVLRYWPQRYRDELRGIVAGMHDGAGGSFDITRLAVINSFDDIAAAWARRPLACSAFAVQGQHGGMLVGRNLDYQVIPHYLAALNTTFIYHPQGETPFVSWGWPGYIGVVTGVNMKRLSLSLLSSPARDASSFGMPEGLVNRLLLESTATPREAFQRLRSLRRTIGNNLLLATASEGCVIESSRSKVEFRGGSMGPLVVTNHYQTAVMAGIQANFVSFHDSLLSPRFSSLEGSQQRAQDLAAQVHIGMTAAEALQLVAQPTLVSAGQVQSVVMDLGGEEIWLADGPSVPVSMSGYRRITFDDLFATGERSPDPGSPGQG